MRVLVVDDDTTQRGILAAKLKVGNGDTVQTASSGEEAVIAAATNDFDLILMDMRMPGIGGAEASRRIREIAGNRGMVPIVGMSAAEAPKSAVGEIDGFLPKNEKLMPMMDAAVAAAIAAGQQRLIEAPKADGASMKWMRSTIGMAATAALAFCAGSVGTAVVRVAHFDMRLGALEGAQLNKDERDAINRNGYRIDTLETAKNSQGTNIDNLWTKIDKNLSPDIAKALVEAGILTEKMDYVRAALDEMRLKLDKSKATR